MGKLPFGGFFMEHINKKRVKGFAVFFAVMAVLLAARLAYIQIFCHDEFTAAAVSLFFLSQKTVHSCLLPIL